MKITDAGTGGHWPANSGLPHVQGLVRRLAHLRSNGVFDMVVNGGVAEVSYGPRTREIAAAWGIEIGDPERATG